MRRALVLGASQRTNNIGHAIAKELRRFEVPWKADDRWDTIETDCWRNAEARYMLPDNGDRCWMSDALVVALGRVQIKQLEEVNDDDTADVVNACLTMPVQAAARYVRARADQGGRVVFVGSYNHNHPLGCGTAYSAAKAGLSMACRSLAYDYAPTFSFVTVHPHYVPGTPMSETAVHQAATAKHTTPGRVEEERDRALLQPAPQTPEEVGLAVRQVLDNPLMPWLSGTGIELFGGAR